MITIAMVAFILGCCALIAGLIAGLAYKFLHIYSYHKIDAIYTVLPHTDCQVCGYDSCLSFARAVAEGKAVPDGCVMGGKKSVMRLPI